MIIKNAYVYGIGHQFRQADLCMEGERIADRAAVDGEETFDAEGLYALPGLLDLHFHGAVGCDLCDADAEGLRKIAEFEWLSPLITRQVTDVLKLALNKPDAQVSVLEEGQSDENFIDFGNFYQQISDGKPIQ